MKTTATAIEGAMTLLGIYTDRPRAIMWECACKEAFSFERANQVARKIRRSRRSDGPSAAYKCKYCGAWHVGHRAP